VSLHVAVESASCGWADPEKTNQQTKTLNEKKGVDDVVVKAEVLGLQDGAVARACLGTSAPCDGG